MPQSASPASRRMHDDKVFLDTSVLVYFFDGRHATKRTAAREWVARLWENKAAKLSWQVLNEFYANANPKIGLAVADARAAVMRFAELEAVDTSKGLINRAWHWMDYAQVNWRDALILASAEQLDCRWLLSEDFQTGRKYGTVTVVNPFKLGPEDLGFSRIGPAETRQ